MKFGRIGSRPFTKVLVLANAVFWFVFIVYFAARSYAYQPHQLMFEEVVPSYIFWGRAFPVEKYMSPFLRATRLIQAPSFYAGRPLFWYFDNRGVFVNDLYAGVSVGGYYLIVVCLLSFAQWYLTGLLMDYFRRRFSISHTPASSDPGHTYNL